MFLGTPALAGRQLSGISIALTSLELTIKKGKAMPKIIKEPFAPKKRIKRMNSKVGLCTRSSP